MYNEQPTSFLKYQAKFLEALLSTLCIDHNDIKIDSK